MKSLLLKFVYWTRLRSLKRASKIRILLITKLKYLIRAIEPEAQLEGYDEGFDQLIHVTALRLVKPEIFGLDDGFPSKHITDEVQGIFNELIITHSEKKEEIDALIRKIEEQQSVKQVLSEYWLTMHFTETICMNEDVAQYNLSRARRMNISTALLTNKDLYSLERSIQKDINNLNDEIADRNALKIDISSAEIVILLSIASSLFLVSGYLYNHLLLSEFGVDVSKFFTLSDYIASSVSSIGYTFSAAAISLLFFFLGAHHSSRKSIAQIHYEQSNPEYWPYFLFGICVIGMFVGYIRDIYEIFYSAGYTTAIFLFCYILPGVSRKYFKKPLPVMFILLFFISFSAHLWSSLGKTIDELRYEDLNKIKIYDIKYKDTLSLPTSDFVLIAANSGYFFLLDENRKIHIINKSQVEYLVDREKKSSLMGSFLFPKRKAESNRQRGQH